MGGPKLEIRQPDYGLAHPADVCLSKALLAKGYCSLGAFREELRASVWGGRGLPKHVADVRPKWSKLLKDFRLTPQQWSDYVDDILDVAVGKGTLLLYAWPTSIEGDGSSAITLLEIPLMAIHNEVLKAVRLDHGGLPMVKLGLRAADVARLEREKVPAPSSNALVVVRLDEAADWLEHERKNGKWPSQQGAGRERKNRNSGRPQTRRLLHEQIDKIVHLGKWDGAQSIPKLMTLLVDEFGVRKLRRDSVLRAVDDMYTLRADIRFKRQFGRHKKSGK